MSQSIARDSYKVPVSCNKDCGAGCPLIAHVENGRLARITNNPAGTPYMTGCVRGFQMPKVVYAPDRLTRPLWRTGPRGSGRFEELAWDEALDRIAGRLSVINAEHGPESVIQLGGSGSCRGALHNTGRLTSRFLGLFGGYTGLYAGYSSAATSFATPYVTGTSNVGLDPGTLQHSAMIILWGANISDLRFGCDLESRIREAKKRGVEVVVIDPRRTRTVENLGTRWIPIRPGTDTAMMMAVLFVLIEEGLIDRHFVDKYSVGFERLERHILGRDGDGIAKTPEWAEGICGTPAPAIVGLARRYGQTHPTALIPGLSIQRNVGGEEAARMGMVLQVATGNTGIMGGSTGGHVWGRLPRPRCGAISAPISGNRQAIPTYRWPDAILEGKAGGYPSDIKAIYNVGGNYITQGSDVRRSIRAFEEVEFAVCHDYFLTPTARYCDVVLPTTTYLERDDIVFPAGNYLFFSNKAIPAPPDVRDDYEILSALAGRLGFGEAFTENRTADEWLESFVAESEIPDYDEFRRTGIYMAEDQTRVGLSDFVADPDTHRLHTPSGRIEIASDKYAAETGFPAIPTFRPMQPGAPDALMLITPHSRYHTHSQCYNIPECCEHEEQALWMHPIDARQRGIGQGDPAAVGSPQGRMRVQVRITDDISPGVVCLLEGTWPVFGGSGVETSGSPNVLTSTEPTLPSQGSRTHSTWVRVEAGS